MTEGFKGGGMNGSAHRGGCWPGRDDGKRYFWILFKSTAPESCPFQECTKNVRSESETHYNAYMKMTADVINKNLWYYDSV